MTIFIDNSSMPSITSTRLEYLRSQVKKLELIEQPEQRSQEWYELRDGMLTASDWATVLGTNPYSKKDALLLKKCGKNMPFPSNSAIDWGVKYEDVATQIYEQRNNVNILLFGCLRHPTIDFLGASPDGITPDGVMVEIKCPSKRVITGTPPVYYWTQVQAQLEVCELDRCDFLECSTSEYKSRDEYIADNHEGDNTLAGNGMEKGCILEFLDKTTKNFKFQYSPIGILGEELDAWIEKTNKEVLVDSNLLPAGPVFWKLDQVSCVPIYRNQEWFQEALKDLSSFWDEVKFWRQEGLEKLDTKIEAEKKKKKDERSRVSKKKKDDKLKDKNKNKIFIDLDISTYTNGSDKPEIDIEKTNEMTKNLDLKKSLFSASKPITNVSGDDIYFEGVKYDISGENIVTFNLKDQKSSPPPETNDRPQNKSFVESCRKSLFSKK